MPATVHLVGSHGAEFDTGFAHDMDEELLARIIDTNCARSPRTGPVSTVETKPASVALHVRNASPADGEAALGARRAAATWDAHATAGKAVLEFAVISTDKGEAVDILREQTARRRWCSSATTSPTRRRSAGCATRRRGQGRARRDVGRSPGRRTRGRRRGAGVPAAMRVLTPDESRARTARAVAAADRGGRGPRPARTRAESALRRLLRDRPSGARAGGGPGADGAAAVARRPTRNRQTAQQRSELAVAGWLADRGHPVVPPSPLVAREPVRREGFSMTFWQFVEEVPGCRTGLAAPLRADRTTARRAA